MLIEVTVEKHTVAGIAGDVLCSLFYDDGEEGCGQNR